MKHETWSTIRRTTVLLVFLLASFYLLFANSIFATEAPRFYFDNLPSKVFGVGSEISVRILTDSPIPLNVYSFSLAYSSEQLVVESVSEAKTILDIRKDWPQPLFSNPLKFSGASFESFLGTQGLMATVTFKTVRPGRIHLEILDPLAYLADGKGTEISVEAGLLEFEVREGAVVYGVQGGDDKVPPTVQEFSLVPDPIYNDEKLVTFLVRDDGSGVRETFIKTRQWFWWDEWQRATNPVVIKKGVWTASLRAIDNSGNVSEQIVYDWMAFMTRVLPLLFVVSIMLLLVMNKLFFRKRL
ncbi:MAG: hypothetical protein G01um101420_961 [Parcubacteria group bacterium Gr01-1014_20]|nr:MAG: hypothetical protein G01um101420_961 [Parcubacteria group bacterium Gr01-1014_20]